MKFILKDVNEKTDFWLVTHDMVSLFEKMSIKYSELYALGKMTNKVTFDEVGSFILLQQLLATYLGKPTYQSPFKANNETEDLILSKVLKENEDIKNYFIELLSNHNKYYYRNTANGVVIMIGAAGNNELDYPGWTLLEGDKISVAIVDVIYKVFGYQDIHFSPVVQTGPDEFSIANAFYALEQGY